MPDSWNLGRPQATPSQLQRATQLYQEAQELGALTDPREAQVFAGLLQTPWDSCLVEFCEYRLESYRIRAAANPDCLRPYPGPESGLDQGDIPLGIIHESGLEYRLSLAALPHVLVVGPTGGGKTNLVHLLVHAISGNASILYITAKEDDARLAMDPPVVERALTFEELRLSLFTAPAGVSAVSWRRSVLELLCRTWSLQLSRSLLHQGADTLAALYDDYANRSGNSVTFTPAALLAWLKRTRTKYTDAPVAVLEDLCKVTGDVFEWAYGYPIEELFTSSTVLSLAGLEDENVARFVVDVLIDAAYRRLTVSGPNDGSVRLVIVLDDGHRFVSSLHEMKALTSLSSKMLIMRQSGIRLVTVSQNPSDLVRAALSQSGVIIQVGGLVHQYDLQAVGAAFGMASRASDRLQQVSKGEFVARENLGRCNRPFAGSSYRFPPPVRPYRDADRRNLMASVLARWPSTPAVPLEVVESSAMGPAGSSTPTRVPAAGLTREALALATDVAAYPFDFLNVRYARLNLAGRVAQKAKQDLVDRGHVREHAIPRRGRPPILLEPMPSLCTLLHHPAPQWGKGGFVHAFMIRSVMNHLAATGHRRIQVEQYFGSKAVDVVAENPSRDIVGFECAHSLTNVVDNLLKDFAVQPRFVSITTVCLAQGDVRQALHAIDNAPGLHAFRGRISVVQLARIL